MRNASAVVELAWQVGAELPARTLPPITRTALALYAGGSGDHNPLHVDIDYARAAGMEDVFAHGMQHVFGLWGGIGLPGLSSALTAFGFRNVNLLVWVTALTELVGGAAVVLGIFTPLAAAGLLALMINAVLLKAANGFFIAGPPGAGAVELEVVLGLGAAALLLTGAGRIALERGRTWNRRPAPWGVLFLIIGVAAALLVFFLLRPR